MLRAILDRHRHGRTLIAVVCGIGALVGPASAASADLADPRAQVVDLSDLTSSVAAARGVEAWSSAKRELAYTYSLRWRENGATRDAPVPRRDAPFDVSLGPAADGHIVAVYSRCTGEPLFRGGMRSALLSSGCDLYRYDPRLGVERRLAVSSPRWSETTPVIWKDRLAWARRREGSRTLSVEVATKVPGRAQRTFAPGPPGPKVPGAARRSDVFGLALRNRTLVVGWSVLITRSLRSRSEIRVMTPSGGHQRVLYAAQTHPNNSFNSPMMSAPAIGADGIWFAYAPNRSTVFRYSRSGVRSLALPLQARVISIAPTSGGIVGTATYGNSSCVSDIRIGDPSEHCEIFEQPVS